MLNSIQDSDLGQKTVPETCFRFDTFIAKEVEIITQNWAKYDHFLEQYPSWLIWPIYVFRISLERHWWKTIYTSNAMKYLLQREEDAMKSYLGGGSLVTVSGLHQKLLVSKVLHPTQCFYLVGIVIMSVLDLLWSYSPLNSFYLRELVALEGADPQVHTMAPECTPLCSCWSVALHLSILHLPALLYTAHHCTDQHTEWLHQTDAE